MTAESLILFPMALLGSAFLIGYCVCYFIVSPILLKKHGVRVIGFWIGGVIYVEHELRELAKKTDDPSVQKTLKVITMSKYAVVLSLLLFVAYGVMRAI